ncbi:hypothetical protein OQL12_002143 [Clostridium perfringens]|nr:hypothetical protein [Clostridium perfringens]MDU6016434.1 hypothetical protein [Clostridium perfringens]
MYNNNPLKRLYNILTELCKCKSIDANKGFSEIFNLDEEDKYSILICYADLFKLCDESKELIKKCPVNNEKFITPIDKAIYALSIIDFNHPSGLRDFRQCLNNTVMTSLDLGAEMLTFQINEPTIDDNSLKQIYEDLNNLKTFIIDNEINIDLKDILITDLNNMIYTIDRYKLFGVSGIKAELSKSLGNILINKDLVKTENEHSVVEKVFKSMSKINTIISFNNNLSNLLTGFLNLIN